MYQNNYKTYKANELYKKACKKMLLKNAFKLYFASVSFHIVNFFAVLFFSRAVKRTRILVFTDKMLNKKICRCQKLYQECEYYKEQIENGENVHNNKKVPTS